MKEFMPLFASITTAVATLGAVYLTQLWSRKTQKDLLEQQIIRDEKKERRNELKETLEVYNQVLKINGENAVIDDNNGFSKLDLKVYQQKIRPILYEKYHLLHDEIAKIVTDMDSIIGYLMYVGGGDDRTEYINLSNKYNKLIENIEQKIRDFRKGDRS